jgi:diguanylate cyclase (GGDEF)-like protein
VARWVYSFDVAREAGNLRHELNVLARLARTLASSTRLDELLLEVVRSLNEVLEVDDCVFFLWDDDERVLVQRAAWGPKLDLDSGAVRNPMRLRLGQGIVGSVAAARLVEIVDDVSIDRRYIEDETPAGSELSVPVLHQDRLVGVLDLESGQRRAFGAEEAIIATRIADLSASSIVLLRRAEQESRRMEEALREVEGRLRHLSTHDSLTGLLGRGPFTEELGSALAATATGGPPLALLALSLDRFDSVNRSLGSAAGDEVLKQVASVLRDRAGRGDLAARVAGVEFALLLRGADGERAIGLAQALRTELASLPLGEGLPELSASFGVAVSDESSETAEEMLGRARRARVVAEDEGGGVASA